MRKYLLILSILIGALSFQPSIAVHAQPARALIARKASGLGPSTTTLDPSAKGTFVALAGSNKTATSTGDGQVLSTVAISGSIQVEFTVTTAGNTVCGLNVAACNKEDCAGNGSDPTGYGIYGPDGNFYHAGSPVPGGTGSAVSNGDKITIGVNSGALTAVIYKNGVLQYGGAVSLAAGTYYFCVGFLSSTGSVTVNYTVATMTYPIGGYGQQ